MYEAARNLDDYKRRMIEVEFNILKQTQETAERCGRARRGILYNPQDFPSSQYPDDIVEFEWFFNGHTKIVSVPLDDYKVKWILLVVTSLCNSDSVII